MNGFILRMTDCVMLTSNQSANCFFF